MASTRSGSLRALLVCALLILAIGQLAAAQGGGGGEDAKTAKKESRPADDDSLKARLCECSTQCIFKPDDRICFQTCMVGRDGTCYTCQEGKPCTDKGETTSKAAQTGKGAGDAASPVKPEVVSG